MKIRLIAIAIFTMVVTSSFNLTSSANPKGVPNQNASGYWNSDRMANAIPRDMQFEPGEKVGKQVPLAKGSGGGSASTNTTAGAMWPLNKDQSIANRTGKIFFTSNGANYVCSGSVVSDPDANRTIVLTAGHCVYDNATQSFVTNLIFKPNYDLAPSVSCENSRYGCWSATALVAHSGFTTETSFSNSATLHDWGFAVFSADPVTNTQLDNLVGSYPLTISSLAKGNLVNAFGYPAVKPYTGKDLVYCSNTAAEDSRNLNANWKLACNMTGGASGGPWLSNFSSTTGLGGSLSSLNSYKYADQKGFMYGPKFNEKTYATYLAALTALSNTAV